MVDENLTGNSDHHANWNQEKKRQANRFHVNGDGKPSHLHHVTVKPGGAINFGGDDADGKDEARDGR